MSLFDQAPPPGLEGTPTLLYESEVAAVWLGDALDVLPDLDTESVDLVVTDPPYGVEWRSNRGRFAAIANDGAADRDAIRTVIAECVRVVGQQRHLYVIGPVDVLDGLKVSESTEIVWDKTLNGLGAVMAPWGPSHERISFTTSKHRHGGETGGVALPVRMRKGTVLRFARPTGRKVRHPTEKPVALLRELIESSSRQGETVLDPFAGVGSTGVAAILAGRRTVLIEIDPNYARQAVDRVRRAEQVFAAGAAL